MLVLMLVSLYTTRVLLNALGIDDYGIFNVVGGLIVMITFISQGLTVASRRYIMAEMMKGTLQSQRVMYTNVFLSHILVCAVIVLVGETIGLWFFSNHLNIPEGRFEASMWVYQLSLVSSIITIMLSPFNAVIVSEEKMSAYAVFSIIDALLKLLIVWLLLIISGDKLIIYALLLVGVGIADYLMYYLYCRFNFPSCRLVKIKGVQQMREIFGYIGWTVLGLSANVASGQGVTILVNIYFSVAVNAAIGISNMIISAANQFVNSFQTAFAPQLIKQYIAGSFAELNGLISRASRYSSLLVLVMLVPICVVISDLLAIWLGDYPEYTEEFCILSFVYIYLNSMSNALTTVISADKNIKKYQIVISCVYLMDFFLCWIILLLGFLPYYVIVVKIFLSIIGVIIRLVMIKNKVNGFSARTWGMSILGRGFLIVLFSTPLLFVNSTIVGTWPLFLRFCSVGALSLIWVAVLIWFLGLTINERIVVLNKAKNLCFRNNHHER